MSDKKLFVVETLSQHRMLYAVEAETQAQAEEFVLNSTADIKEMGQNHLGESVFCAYETNEDDYIEAFDDINDYLKEWTREKKLEYINKTGE